VPTTVLSQGFPGGKRASIYGHGNACAEEKEERRSSNAALYDQDLYAWAQAQAAVLAARDVDVLDCETTWLWETIAARRAGWRNTTISTTISAIVWMALSATGTSLAGGTLP
jgi:hypothetical protein